VEPVVLIHGIFQMLGDLPASEFFAPRPVHIPDMLGYGSRAEVPAEKISLESQADDLAEQIRARRGRKAHIVGHSVGGAVAMLLAHRNPHLVASVINVEGNFTLQDAFWTGKLAAMSLDEIRALLQGYHDDPKGWLERAGIEPTPTRVASAALGLRAQPATTVKAMAQSVIATTGQPSYLRDVDALLDSGLPLHLFAGGRSRAGWHVPEQVIQRAQSFTVQPGVGHMMMLEAPEEFLRLIAKLVA
jgi:lipase